MAMKRTRKWRDDVLNTLEALNDELGKGSWDEKAIALSEEFEDEYTAHEVRMGSRKLKKRGPMKNAEPTFEDLVADRKQKELAAKHKGAVNMEVRRQAFSELLLDTLETCIKPLKWKQPKFKPPQPASGGAEDAVLFLSDLHFGKLTRDYNMEVGKRRLSTLIRKVESITALHRKAFPVRRLHILWGGDIVDGETIFPTQTHHIDTNVVNQVFGAAPHVLGELAQLAGYFDSVSNYCVRGNHGRITKFAHEDSNFDNFFYHTLALASRNIPNMTWKIPDGWHCIAEIAGMRILLIHGDQIKMTFNLPWYGITTRASRWAASKSLGGYDLMALGHFHTSSCLRWNDKHMFTNGTMGTGDEFALEKIGLESSECQWYFGLKDGRITWQYELDYDERGDC